MKKENTNTNAVCRAHESEVEEMEYSHRLIVSDKLREMLAQIREYLKKKEQYFLRVSDDGSWEKNTFIQYSQAKICQDKKNMLT